MNVANSPKPLPGHAYELGRHVESSNATVAELPEQAMSTPDDNHVQNEQFQYRKEIERHRARSSRTRKWSVAD